MKEQRTSPNSMETKEYLKTSSRLFSSPSSPTSSSPSHPPSSCFVVVLPPPFFFLFLSLFFLLSFLPFICSCFTCASRDPEMLYKEKFFSITFCVLGLKCRMHFLLSLESPRVNKPRTLKWPKCYISSLFQNKFCRTYLDTDTCLFSSS